jgi:OOP family OmpA-OmpF porin
MSMNKQLTCAISVLCSMMVLPSVGMASVNTVVRDSAGGVVKSVDGNCVRTQWEADSDACATKPEPKPVVAAPAPQPVEPSAPVFLDKEILSKSDRTIYFGFDSAKLEDSEKAKLDAAAEKLKLATSVKSVSIVGYADVMGSTAYNQTLSEKRAQAVEVYLNSKGYLNTDIAKVRALGEAYPKADCSKSVVRAEKIVCLKEDRRVELEIEFVQVIQVEKK